MNPFKQLGELNNLRKQAAEMQKKLSQERVEINENGVRVVMSGEQKILELEIDGASDNTIKDKINKALGLSQQIAAKKLQEMSGGLSGMMNMLKQ